MTVVNMILNTLCCVYYIHSALYSKLTAYYAHWTIPRPDFAGYGDQYDYAS